MYKQLKKQKEDENRRIPNSVSPKKSNNGENFGLVDNRPAMIAQRKVEQIATKGLQNKHLTQLQSLANRYTAQQEYPTQLIQANTGTIQLKTVTVKNKINNYSSGWQQNESLSTGVDSGPQAEAQKVASIAGGNWVGGHMVNDRLGGTGGFSNIVPITSSMNGKHHTIENQAQNKVGGGLGPYEVNYHMNILARKDFDFGGKDEIKNMPYRFQQSYDWRDKKKKTPVTTVTGVALDMFDFSTQEFI